MLRNRVILVTGGASGIGLVIAQGLAGHGAELIVTGVTQGQVDDAVAKLGFYATGVLVDPLKVADVDQLFSRVRNTHGRLDVLVVTAVTTGINSNLPLGRITERAFDQMFDTNVKSVAFTLQAARPMMGDGGAIVVIGDYSAIDREHGTSLDRATKSALSALIEGWTDDLKEIGVRVNLLTTSSTITPIGTQGATPEGKHVFCPFNRRWSYEHSSPQNEIVKVATFLASDSSRYLNGVELFVSKG